MPRSSLIYEVVIASPGDVKAERALLTEVIEDWNSAHLHTTGVSLLARRWELDGIPATGAQPQELLNKQFVEGGDVLIGVFWTRLGTPTRVAASGTVEEIELFRRQGKPVLLYFSEADIPHGHDPEQFQLLQEYRDSLKADTLYATFKSEADLRRKVTRDLANQINRLVFAQSNSKPTGPATPPTKNEFARVSIRPGNKSFQGVIVLTLFGEIENLSAHRRIREYSCTLTIPSCCLTFTSAHQAAEVRSDETGYRKFRYTEINHSRVQLFPGDKHQVLSVDIAVGQLTPEERTRCLGMMIKADAVVDGEILQVVKRVEDFIGS